MIPLAVWNVRGLNRLDHRRSVRELVRDSNRSVIGLLETRVAEPNATRISTSLLPSWNWFFDYSEGPGNRVWIGWDPTVVSCEITGLFSQGIHSQIIDLRDNSSVAISFIYAFNEVIDRRPLWDELIRFSESVVAVEW